MKERKQKRKNKTAELSSHISISTLNTNDLNIPSKTEVDTEDEKL